MVPLSELLLPILVASALVFFASFVLHMVLGYHAADYRGVPSEDAVMDALRPFNIPPGDYMLPKPSGANAMKDPAFVAKWTKGPAGILTIFPPGNMGMNKQLGMWFVFTMVVGLFAAYVASLAMPRGASYMGVFRMTSTVAFIGYGLAQWENSIWYHRSWGTTIRNNIDALVYGLLTGGAFGWLWPN